MKPVLTSVVSAFAFTVLAAPVATDEKRAVVDPATVVFGGANYYAAEKRTVNPTSESFYYVGGRKRDNLPRDEESIYFVGYESDEKRDNIPRDEESVYFVGYQGDEKRDNLLRDEESIYFVGYEGDEKRTVPGGDEGQARD